MARTLALNVAPGATVNGVVNLAATADTPLSKVRFHLDGAQVTEDVGFPWAWSWDTRNASEGAHTIQVKAIKGGRVVAKRSITVTVDNVTGPPVGGTVNLSGTGVGTGSGTGTLQVSSGGGVLTAYWGARIRASFYQDRSATYPLSAYVDVPLNNSTPVWDLFEAHAGKRVTCVHTGTGGNSWPLPSYQTSQADNARARGAFLNYTLGTTPAGLQNIIAMNASAVSVLTTFFTQIRNHGHPILFRPFWEMNGSWYSWGKPGGSGSSVLTDANYVTLWRNLWGACADVMSGNGTAGSGTGTHTGNVSFFWCPNVIDVADPSGRYPGSAYVDWLGFDGYAANTGYQSPATRFNSTYALLETLDAVKPFFIGETGANPDMGTPFKSGWITDFLSTWLPAHPRVKGFSWFNEYGSPNLPHIEVGNGATTLGGAVQTAFANGIADPYFKANIVTAANFPSGGKIPVPAGSGGAGGLSAFENNADGGTLGATVTTGNSGGGSGDAWSSVTGPGTSGVVEFTNSRVLHGPAAYRVATRATSEQEFLQWDNGSDVSETYGRMYFLLSAIPTSGNCKLLTLRVSSGATNLTHVSISTAALLQVRDGADAIVWTGSSTLAIETWYRLEYHYTASGSTSKMEARLAVGDSSTLLETSGDQTTGGSSSAFAVTRYGITIAGANLPTAASHLYMDDFVGFADGWPGPLTSSPSGKKNSAEGGTNAVTPTTSDTGSGDAFSAVTGPGTAGVMEYSTVQAMHGTKSIRYATRGTAEQVFVAWDNGTAVTDAYGRCYVRFDNINATTRVVQWRVGAATTVLGYINLSSAGVVQLKTGTDTLAWTGPTLSINTWYRIEWHVDPDAAGSSSIQVRVYAGDGGTVVGSGDSGVIATSNGGASNAGIGYVRYGQASSTTNVPSTTGFVYLDDLAAFQTTWPGVGP